MMTPSIIHSDENDEYYFEEGCFILELSNSETDPDVSIARARVSPQTETRLHQLFATVERYIILEGSGLVSLDKAKPVGVSKNDIVIIPPQCPQKIANDGDTDLVFLAICSPRFIKENYVDCE